MTTEDMAAALWCEACEHWKHEHPAGLPCPWHQDLRQPNPDSTWILRRSLSG